MQHGLHHFTPKEKPAYRNPMRQFEQSFTAQSADIDELGHVNNAVWVRWVQDLATAHWAAVATPEQVASYVWVVVRHEIDYAGNLNEGESLTGRTWVAQEARSSTATPNFRNKAASSFAPKQPGPSSTAQARAPSACRKVWSTGSLENAGVGSSPSNAL